MPRAGKPHWRHEAWIYIYALTLPTFSMPHSHFSPWNPCWTQRNQITTMFSIRTGRRYSTRPSMPSSPTFRQGSHVSSLSSMMSNSVLGGLTPYRQWEQIPDITLPEYGTIIKDDDDYEDLMAILFPQSDLYSRTITMRHLSITAQKLRREVDRQEVEVKRIFVEMEGLGLQQVLHPYQDIPPWESFSPAAWLPTPYYPAPSQETRSPTPPPMSPPLGTPGNLIIIEDDEELDGRSNNFYTAESTFSTLVFFLLHCQECTDRQHQYYKCPQYICDHCYRQAPGHQVSDCQEGHWSQWLQS